MSGLDSVTKLLWVELPLTRQWCWWRILYFIYAPAGSPGKADRRSPQHLLLFTGSAMISLDTEYRQKASVYLVAAAFAGLRYGALEALKSTQLIQLVD